MFEVKIEVRKDGCIVMELLWPDSDSPEDDVQLILDKEEFNILRTRIQEFQLT